MSKTVDNSQGFRTQRKNGGSPDNLNVFGILDTNGSIDDERSRIKIEKNINFFENKKHNLITVNDMDETIFNHLGRPNNKQSTSLTKSIRSSNKFDIFERLTELETTTKIAKKFINS